MNTLYLDVFSGISGDMFLGAMIDLGVSLQQLEQELKKLRIETIRARKKRQVFKFKSAGDYLEATDQLAEPHEFEVVLDLGRGRKAEKIKTTFTEDGSHHHHDQEESRHEHDQGRSFADIKK